MSLYHLNLFIKALHFSLLQILIEQEQLCSMRQNSILLSDRFFLSKLNSFDDKIVKKRYTHSLKLLLWVELEKQDWLVGLVQLVELVVLA